MLERAHLLLFDLDGTLLDTETAIAVGFNRALAEFGFEGEIADTLTYYRAWADVQREDFERYLVGEQTFDQNRLHRTSSLLHLMTGNEPSASAAQSFLATLQQETRAAWAPFAELDKFFEHLSVWHPDLEVAVISNGYQHTEQAKLNAIGLDDMPLYTSEKLGMSKPDPHIFRYVCAELETDPAYTIHIGDNYIADVAAPARAGLQAIWVNRHRRQQRIAKGAVKVRSLTEITRFA